MDVKVLPHLSQHHVRSCVNMELKGSSIRNVTSICKWVTGKVSESFEKIAYLRDMISFGFLSYDSKAGTSWWVKHKRETTDFSLGNWKVYSCTACLIKQSQFVTVSYLIEKIACLQDTISFGYISSLNGCEGAATIKPAPCKLWCQSGIVRFKHSKCRIHL
jgi:hypothetical protein